jgi:hypothetical protein
VKTYRSFGGPFAQRPYYRLEEIEQMCWDELQAVELYPSSPQPIRVDRFVEKRFKIAIAYEELPNGLLGFTEFGDNGVKSIVVAEVLDGDSQSGERRLRTTLAHEAGHCLLHTHLMVLGAQSRSLFEGGLDEKRPRILCRNESVLPQGTFRKYTGQWWEFQANQAMGALLLPRALVQTTLGDLLVGQGTLGKRTIPPERREQAAELLSEVFEVNPIVATLRLAGIYPTDRELQLTL